MRVVRSALACTILGVLAACTNEPSRPSEPAESELASARKNPERYIVVLKPTSADPEIKVRHLEKTYGGKRRQIYRSVFKGFSAALSPSALAELRRDPMVDYIEPVLLTTPSNHTTQSGAPANLDRIDQQSRPLSGTYGYIATGSGVNVYLLDSGILTTHTQLGFRATNVIDFVPEDGAGGRDCSGHGTKSAGIVGATTYGVAKGVTMKGLRIYKCSTGTGSTDDLVAALDWLKTNRVRPAVANVSSQVVGTSTAVDNAVRSTIAAGVIVVIAAGNSSADACSLSPSRVTEALIVGNINPTTDVKGPSSNFGTCVDLFAPGDGSTSLGIASNTATASFNQTSAALPHVSGVAALYLQNNPTAAHDIVAQAIKNATTKNVLSGLGAGSPNLLLNSVAGSMVVTVGGPSSVSTATPHTWTAAVAGGLGHFTYRWEMVQVVSGSRFTFGSTSSTLTVTPAASWNLFQIVAYARSSGSPEARGVKTVANRIPGSCTFC